MRVTRFRGLVLFWESEWSLSVLLFVLAALIFVVLPAQELGARRWFLDVSSSLVLVSGIWAVSRHKTMTIIVAAITFVGLPLHWAKYISTGALYQKGDALLTLTAFLLMAGVVAAKVFQKGPITLYRIQGAVVIYLLLGLAWSRAYMLIEMLKPGAFQMGGAGAGYLTSELTYYSFVTLTSVGYGDINAVHPAARSLAAMEAVVGQLFPAILIARLVAMEMAQSKRIKHGD